MNIAETLAPYIAEAMATLGAMEDEAAALALMLTPPERWPTLHWCSGPISLEGGIWPRSMACEWRHDG